MFACFPSFLGSATHEEPPTVTAQDTIQRLRENVANQEKREHFVERKMKVLALQAKESVNSGDKTKAVQLLRKRKMYGAELAKIGNIKMTLETQAIQLESAAGTAEAFQAMSVGTNTMQNIRTGMGGVDNVDEMMMDMQDEFQMHDEVNNVIGQAIDPMLGNPVDEDELMKELQLLEGSNLSEKFDAAEGRKAPAPSKKSDKSRVKDKQQNDLKMLEAELAAL